MPADAPAFVTIDELYKHYGRNAALPAVDGVSFEIRKGECLGLVGESGSGKTTVARCVTGLVKPTRGRIMVDGADTTSRKGLRATRGRIQMVFQDPYDALNPRMRVIDSVSEPLFLADSRSTRSDREHRAAEVLGRVQLDRQFLERKPSQLSGGQRQRVGIARSLATSPDFVVLDEPTSALDWMTRCEIIELINALRAELGLTYLFISHDIGAVAAVADRVAVMNHGQIVEIGSRQQVLGAPQHDYTRALLSAVLEPRVGATRAHTTRRDELHDGDE
jgi:peptide/nickel transport system ATP-binding protein